MYGKTDETMIALRDDIDQLVFGWANRCLT